MDRETRLQLWTDEAAHPLSIATRVAMEASGADMSLASDWADLEGHNEPSSTWMCYLDFLKGAIGIAQDRDPKAEFDPPATHKGRAAYLARLWNELEKAVGEEPHNGLAENQREHDQYQALLRQREVDKLTEARAQSMLLPGTTDHTTEMITIISIPGKFYARYDGDAILGFGFVPHAGDAGYFGPSAVYEDGPTLTFDPSCNDQNPFWDAVRKYLENTELIGGEAAMHVVWAEDGWSTEPEG